MEVEDRDEWSRRVDSSGREDRRQGEDLVVAVARHDGESGWLLRVMAARNRARAKRMEQPPGHVGRRGVRPSKAHLARESPDQFPAKSTVLIKVILRLSINIYRI
jgi:hypothetical protein